MSKPVGTLASSTVEDDTNPGKGGSMTVRTQERPTKARIRDVLQKAINYVVDDVDLLSRYPEEAEQGERLIGELREVRNGLDRVSVEECHEYDKGFADAIDGYRYAEPWTDEYRRGFEAGTKHKEAANGSD